MDHSLEQDLDLISDAIPKGAAALVIGTNGEVTCLVPNMDRKAQVPPNVLAITELIVQFAESDLTVHELAEAFKKRKPS